MARAMTSHTLEATKGWPSQSAVDFTAKPDATALATITGNVFYAGRVVHLNNSGTFELGVIGTQMALFLFNNSDDPDSSNPDGGDPATSSTAWVPVAPSGKLLALVASGAYELASTEFLNTVTYNPNDLLYAPTGTTLATSGVLTKTGAGGAYPLTSAVGVVSRGRTTSSPNNANGVAELYFWPIYLPSHSHA